MSLDNIEQVVFNPNLYIDGCQLTWTSLTTVTIGTGKCRDSNDVIDISVNTPIVLSTGVVGAGGLDEGSMEAGIVYFVYLLADPTGFNRPTAVFSKNNTSKPFMPLGYSSVRRVGRFLSASTTNIAKFYSGSSTGRDRFIQLDIQYPIIIAGSATSFTAIDMPYGAYNDIPNVVFLNALLIPQGINDHLDIKPYGSATTSGQSQIVLYGSVAAAGVSVPMIQILPVMLDGVPTLQYSVTGTSSASIFLSGYIDSL